MGFPAKSKILWGKIPSSINTFPPATLFRKGIERDFRPFKKFPSLIKREFKRGVSPFSIKFFPLPLVKGKGIKGMGF